MKLSCIFGHKWNGCTCERCGEKRDEEHAYGDYRDERGKCVGRCKCGKAQTLEHDWQTVPGKCIKACTRCGKEQSSWQAEHTWERVPGTCQQKCAVCGKTREIDANEHDWQRVEGKCVEMCAICGKERKVGHNWQRIEGKCLEKCTVCGEQQELEHQWTPVEDTDREKCAVCGKVRLIPGLAAYRKDPDTFMDDCVEKLLAIFPTTPLDYEGHKRFDAAHRAEVRKIGEQLDKLGGMRAMRRVGEAFANRRPIHARKLETTWSGIGNWMG